MTTQAQPLECSNNPEVVGSNPTPATKTSKAEQQCSAFSFEAQEARNADNLDFISTKLTGRIAFELWCHFCIGSQNYASLWGSEGYNVREKFPTENWQQS